jgi:hypothetical protein
MTFVGKQMTPVDMQPMQAIRIGRARLGGPPNLPCPWLSGQIQELRWFRDAGEEYNIQEDIPWAGQKKYWCN